MSKKNFGIRRSEEDLESAKAESRKLRFVLQEQENFNGSKELLEAMQNYERLYREGTPEITDEEWDDLVKKTGYIESLDQALSPSGRRWVKMGSPLVSLKKTESLEGIKDFYKKHGEVVVSPKFDGLTFVAFYQEQSDGSLLLSDIGSRGDGLNSLIVHEDALKGVQKKWLPDQIDKETTDKLRNYGCILNGRFELRGEVLIDKYEYAKDNRVDVDSIVPRNIAAGIMNRKLSYSLDYILDRVWEETGKTQGEPENKLEFVKSQWKLVSKETKKILSNFNIVNRGTSADALAVYLNTQGEIQALVLSNGEARELCSSELGKTKIEKLYFVSFSVASKDGNIDRREIIESIKGAKYPSQIPEMKDVFKISSNYMDAVDSLDYLYGSNMLVRDPSKERHKNTCRFATDGVVLKPVGSNRKTQGVDPVQKSGKIVVRKAPLDQIAVKLRTDPSKTKILEIIKTKTKLGNVTVRAKIEPTVVEGGAVVKSVNLHNENWLSLPENSWIKEGVECNLRMSMDIIPILSKIE